MMYARPELMVLRPRAFVIAGCLALGIVFVAMFFRNRKVLRFPYMSRPLSEADYRSLGSKPGWQTRVIERGQGVSLRGLVRKRTRPGAPFVLFFNGNSSTLLREGQEVLSRLCVDPGWGAAVWAYRGYDGSTGKPSPGALADDAWYVYQALLRDESLEPGDVHVVAFSLGTSIATGLAARAQAPSFASLTLLAPVTEMDAGERFQLSHDRYETLKDLDAIKAPTLVIHGTKDTTLPVEGGKLVASRLGARAKFIELPNDGHFELLDSETVAEAVRSFISTPR